MNYIDTHSHLSDEAFVNDIEDVIQRAKEEGVEHILMPDIGIEGREELMALCAAHSDILHPMIGVHPTTINDNNGDWRGEIDAIKELLRSGHEKYCAIGEIGLDYYWSREFVSEQREAFIAQCELAIEYNLPVNIHTRDAWEDMCATLELFKGRGLRGVMHAFCDTAESFRRIDACGDFMFSFGGVITYKKALAATVISEIPLEKILLETDAPYLTPTPHRGKRNEPAYVQHTCAKIAELLGTTPEAVAEASTRNATKMFQL